MDMFLKVFKNANLALAFLLELCVLAALLYWGFSTGSNILAKIALGIGTPVVAIIIWALFGAPNSARRLKGVWYWLLRLVLDAIGALALYVASQHTLGAIFALIAVLNCTLAYAWKQ